MSKYPKNQEAGNVKEETKGITQRSLSGIAQKAAAAKARREIAQEAAAVKASKGGLYKIDREEAKKLPGLSSFPKNRKPENVKEGTIGITQRPLPEIAEKAATAKARKERLYKIDREEAKKLPGFSSFRELENRIAEIIEGKNSELEALNAQIEEHGLSLKTLAEEIDVELHAGHLVDARMLEQEHAQLRVELEQLKKRKTVVEKDPIISANEYYKISEELKRFGDEMKRPLYLEAGEHILALVDLATEAMIRKDLVTHARTQLAIDIGNGKNFFYYDEKGNKNFCSAGYWSNLNFDALLELVNAMQKNYGSYEALTGINNWGHQWELMSTNSVVPLPPEISRLKDKIIEGRRFTVTAK